MRVATTVLLCLALALLAGCDGNGGGDGNGDVSWAGPPEPAADGTVIVAEFVALQEDVDERWERSAETAAAEFLRVDERVASRTTIDGAAEGEGEGPRTVLVTFDGLFDDSVRSERWTLVFQPEGDAYRLESAARTLRCHPGRGHQDFAPEPCV